MKPRGLILVFALGLIVSAFGQKATMELTFTADNNGQYVPLDSIFIENLTQGGDTTLYEPDTVLVLDFISSIGDNEAIGRNTFSVSQNYPNPFIDQTTINLYLSEKEDIKITVRDILGRELAQYDNTLNRGIHSFTFSAGNDKYYLLTVTGEQMSKTIKMLNANNNSTYDGKCKVVYNEYEDIVIGFKSQKAFNNFGFNMGDELKYTAYSIFGDTSITDSPTGNQTYTFQYAIGIPCPGTPTVTYEGQVYNTVLIGSQCWLKENLNVGAMINGNDEMSDNGIIEKYCYQNNFDNCDTYGGLYQWPEMMEYNTTAGTQGICPPDWHIPTDEEWKQLEGEVDSYYGYPDPEWDYELFRGYDVGLNLKSKGGWNSGGNGTDIYNFTYLPAGSRHGGSGGFMALGNVGYLWSSTEYSTIFEWYRGLAYSDDQVYRFYVGNGSSFSVRCVKD